MNNANSFSRRLGGAVSALALSAGATLASAAFQPAAAGNAIYGGGSSLFSIAFRQLADCYHGVSPAGIATYRGCNVVGRPNVDLEALYAGVGSGAGRRAFITGDEKQMVLNSASPLSLPAVLPIYRDTTGFVPGVYPYPRLDFGASDEPLPLTLSAAPFTNFSPASGWETLPTPPASPITATVGASVNYDPTKTGKVIQLPGAEVGVAIGVNAPLPSSSPWQIDYQGGTVMHLSQHQLCAIFSGTVTNWNDSTTSIAYRDSSNLLQSEVFRAGNTPSALPYTSSSLPITVAYRSDGSGTTFIMTNFLNAVCPFFDDGVNQYQKIFAPTPADITAGYKAIPTTRFSDLIANVNKAFPARATTTATWIGSSGNLAVAGSIGNAASNPTFSGRIGYVSSDFAKPYSKLANAPLAAAVQNEAQRLAGVYHPSPVAPFKQATPLNVNDAWKELVVPDVANLTNYDSWNVYAQQHSVFGGQSKSILATPTRVNAYPLSGTAFLFFYTCYADPTGARVSAITDFLSWIYAGSDSIDFPAGTPSTSTRNAPKYDVWVKEILKLNGFYPVPRPFGFRILKYFVRDQFDTAITAYRTTGAQVRGCKGVTGGGQDL